MVIPMGAGWDGRGGEGGVRAAVLLLVALPLVALLGGCASWEHDTSGDSWTLYVRPGGGVDAGAYRALLDPAVAAVEAELGPFRRPVRVHAWQGGVDLSSGTRGVIADGEDAGVVESELGTARVRAFHVRGDPFGPGGIFLGEPSPGSAVHELVHARFAELPEVPLWFEEGLAMFLGDGELVRPVEGLPYWVRDGLCAWPRAMLREARPTDTELESVLALRSGVDHTIEENLLVHFIGWALVFDLYREDPGGTWWDWLQTFERDPSDAPERVARSLDRGTQLVWLNEGLTHAEPGVRMATARGQWRGASSPSLQLLSSALRHEQHVEVRATLAINLLAAAGQGRFAGMGRWNGLRLPLSVLEELEFGTPDDRAAARRLVTAFLGRGGDAADIEAAFRDLEPYWQE